MKSSGSIHLRAVLQEIIQTSVTDMCFKFIQQKLITSPRGQESNSNLTSYHSSITSTRWVDGTPTSVRSLHLTLVTKWSRSHMTLKIQISRSWPRSNPLVTFEALSSNQYVCFSFRGNRTTFGWDIANFIIDLENSKSRSWRKSTKI